ncbi:MAG: pectinesterase family protein [Candidatus Dactylopiibacterium sp.]|nr:pectinesterase family protein [Candidatus Dactylopiibacterium sp.]
MNSKQKLLGLAVVSTLVMAGCATSLEGPIAKSTPARPQLSESQAAAHTPAAYFAKSGNIEALETNPWDPVRNGIADLSKVKPAFVVAADGTGTHKTVQAALDAAIAKGGSERIYVQVKPGTYREQVCLKDAPPVTIYGSSSDASRVVIVNNKANSTTKPKDETLNACEGRKGADSYGTSGSSTFLAYADDFQAKNLTVSNDYDERTNPRGPQAVALNTRGDRVILDNVRLLGHQDTLMVKSPNMGDVDRVYVTNSYIEGDVDFVFGRAVAVFDKVEFKSLTDRERAEGGYVFAPSQPQNFPHGYLVINSKFTSDANKAGKKISLGRSWDEGASPYVAKDGSKHLPNGMVVIRNSAIGAHIDAAEPWDKAASTGRPFNAEKPQVVQFGAPKVATEFPVNRLFEYRNSGPGAAK